MQELLLKGYIFYLAIGVSFLMGSIVKIWEWRLYCKLIQEAEKAGKSENSAIKQLRIKVKSCCKLDLKIKNTKAFLEAFLYKCEVYKVRPGRLRRIGNTCVTVCMGIGTAAVLWGVFHKLEREYMVYQVSAVLLSVALLQGMEALFSCEERRKEVIVILEDYLDNFLISRLMHKRDVEVKEGKEAAAAAEKKTNEYEKENREENYQLLTEVLDEYLS